MPWTKREEFFFGGGEIYVYVEPAVFNYNLGGSIILLHFWSHFPVAHVCCRRGALSKMEGIVTCAKMLKREMNQNI